MRKDLCLLVSRFLLSLPFLWSGFDKALHWSQGLSEITTAQLPNAALLLAATIFVQILGGLSVAAGIYSRAGALLLAGFTFVATLLFHSFWTHADSTEYQHELNTFLEHLAIIGGFIATIGTGSGRFSIDGVLRHRPDNN